MRGHRANQLWAWVITKLKSVVKWNYFYLYGGAGYLQPLRGTGWWRLARSRSWPAVAARELPEPRHPDGPTDDTFGSWSGDDFQTSAATARRSRRHQESEPATRLE